MKQEILIKLKTAEAEAADRAERAREEAAKRVQTARREATKLVQDAEAKARTQAEESIAAKREELEGRRAEILDAGGASEDALRTAYSERVDAAVAKAVKAFERSLDA